MIKTLTRIGSQEGAEIVYKTHNLWEQNESFEIDVPISRHNGSQKVAYVVGRMRRVVYKVNNTKHYSKKQHTKQEYDNVTHLWEKYPQYRMHLPQVSLYEVDSGVFVEAMEYFQPLTYTARVTGAQQVAYRDAILDMGICYDIVEKWQECHWNIYYGNTGQRSGRGTYVAIDLGYSPGYDTTIDFTS